MSDLSGSISAIFVQPVRVDVAPSQGSGSITLKINGLPYLFDPSKKQAASPLSQAIMVATTARPGVVVQTFFQLRQEDPSIGNAEEATVYRIELDESEHLDADPDEEFTEPFGAEEEIVEVIDEEMDENDDPEESSFSDNKPAMQDGDFLNEDEEKEALYEMMQEETIADKRAKKMWQKTKRSILESLQKKSKTNPVLSIQFEPVSYFSFLSNK